MTGIVLQVNVSRGGLPKRAIFEGRLTADGFEGDSWAHPQFHGGPNQAVLMIANEAIEGLRGRGYPVYPGAMGENLTTIGLEPENWRKGQQYLVGDAIVELTKVREPCSQLNVFGAGIQKEVYDSAVKAGDSRSPKWALGGFYARVVRAGLVLPGNEIRLLTELA